MQEKDKNNHIFYFFQYHFNQITFPNPPRPPFVKFASLEMSISHDYILFHPHQMLKVLVSLLVIHINILLLLPGQVNDKKHEHIVYH